MKLASELLLITSVFCVFFRIFAALLGKAEIESRNFTTPATVPFYILSLASMTGQEFGGMQLLKQSP